MGENMANRIATLRSTPGPWVAVIVGIVFASPALQAVRQAVEPGLGGWAAYAVGILAASVMGLLVYSLVDWIIRRERLARPGDLAPMVYRPAIAPVWIFAGAVLKNLPSALTEWVAWAYLGCLVLLLAGTVLMQRRRGRAWSWWVAVPISFGIALLAWFLAMGVAQIVAPHEVRPG